MTEGLDYHDTFSPVTKMVIVRTIISLATSRSWSISDVSNAFLQIDFFEQVYMKVPRGFSRQGDQMVYKLVKSLHGLKQVSRQ